jgi:hypothetical protein
MLINLRQLRERAQRAANTRAPISSEASYERSESKRMKKDEIIASDDDVESSLRLVVVESTPKRRCSEELQR